LHEYSEQGCWSFLAQQCAALIIPFSLLLCVVTWLEPWAWFEEGAAESRLFSTASVYAIVGAISLLLGGVVWGFSKDAACTGRRVWVLPVCVLVVAFVGEAIANLDPRYGGHALRTTIREFFYPQQKDGFVFAAFLSVPAWSCVCYSVLLQVLSRRTAKTGFSPELGEGVRCD
jgi:hypothetical protein